MAIDIFANNASATVSSGGTTAPAAGTSETWTLSSIVNLAASSGVTQMRLVDPAAPSEIMLLTDLSGTSATVTRGAEGTTPVAHSAGFTVKVVATADGLGNGPNSDGYHPGIEGYLAWSYSIEKATTRGQPGGNASGRLSGTGLIMPVSAQVSYVSFVIEIAGSGFTAGQNFIGIYDYSGNLLAQTADISVVITGSGRYTIALASPLSVKAGQYLRVAWLINATTIPQLIGTQSDNGAGMLPHRGARPGNNTYTTLPASVTFTNSDYAFWVALS